ncbi:histone-lysine N-methyltransferase PRDM9 [Amia ocellicauda]|uniref:histone-lysine N-methyltransferase PRDM9 n=1 Tax=Amia ocellicauda TaxID=2972642 RepID=UPI00346470CE
MSGGQAGRVWPSLEAAAKLHENTTTCVSDSLTEQLCAVSSTAQPVSHTAGQLAGRVTRFPSLTLLCPCVSASLRGVPGPLDECEVHSRLLFVTDAPRSAGLRAQGSAHSAPGPERAGVRHPWRGPGGVRPGPPHPQRGALQALRGAAGQQGGGRGQWWFVNCTQNEEEQNLMAFQYRGQVYYKCFQPTGPGCELLVWYGEEYTRELGITWDYLWDKKSRASGSSVPISSQVFPCTQCSVAFTAQLFLHKHMKRCHPQEYLTLLRSGSIRAESLLPTHCPLICPAPYTTAPSVGRAKLQHNA